MKKTLLTIITCLIAGIVLHAQDITITGNVTDGSTGTPLPGVNVFVKENSERGTVTDVDGDYSIVVSKEQTLVFSFIGYLQEEVIIGDQSVIDISMSPDLTQMDEVIVIGYGEAKRSDLSGASVSVSGTELMKSTVANVDQALQGKAAGVVAVRTSGQPGSAMSIRIRGQGTINADAEPLYVIDGIPVQNVSESGHDVGLGDNLGNGDASTFSGLSAINPADIVSVEILKDASATAIYGSRGSNGVVIITTKRGDKGKATFNYETYFGVQKQIKRMDVLNLHDYSKFMNDWTAETSITDSRIELRDPSLLGDGTDWQDAVFQTARIQSHQLSASGGTDKAQYFISGSYFDQEGTVVGSDFKRLTSRINIDANLKSWFKVGVNILMAKTEENIGLNNSTEGIISVALVSSPDIPVKNVDGSWAGDSREGTPGRTNPIAKALDEDNLLKRMNLITNLYADINIWKGLSNRTEIGFDLKNTNAYHFTPSYKYGSKINETNEAMRRYNQNFFWQFKDYITYTTTINKNYITAMVGFEASEWSWENLSGRSADLPSNDIQEPDLGDPTTMEIGSGHGSGAIASAFTRLSYNYAERYYATYTYRYDGSSNFGPENRWAGFHAFATSWRVSNEAFMQPFTSVISNLKIRAGWGQTGNQDIEAYSWGSSIQKMPSNLGPGYRQYNIANPYVSWESQKQINFGVDLSVFQNRISLVFDAYKKTSTDMLMRMQLPSYMGTRGNVSIQLQPPFGNFGKIENKGIEITLTTRPFVNEFKWENSIIFTRNRNKLLGLDDTPATHIEGYGQWVDVVSISEIGEPLYNFFGYKVAGVYKDKNDIENSPRTEEYPADENFWYNRTIWPGDLKFEDISGPQGKPDGVIDSYDKTNIGSPLPKFTFGINNTFEYKGFELSIFINGSYGNKILNYVGRSLTLMDNRWDNQLSTVLDRTVLEPINPNKVYLPGDEIYAWFVDIDNVKVANDSDIPRAIAGDPNSNKRISDRYIEDGSYLRFKNITFGYNLPSNIVSKVGMQNMKIYVSMQNMWTITKYTGFDPEVGSSQTSNNVMGLDNGRYPSPRIISFGAKITF